MVIKNNIKGNLEENEIIEDIENDLEKDALLYGVKEDDATISSYGGKKED